MSSLKCIQSLSCFYVYFLLDGNHLDLHVLTHSVPTRRTSDLAGSAASTSGTAGSGPSLLTSPPRRQSRCHARAGTAPASTSPRPSRRRPGGNTLGDAASPRRVAGRRRGGSRRARSPARPARLAISSRVTASHAPKRRGPISGTWPTSKDQREGKKVEN